MKSKTQLNIKEIAPYLEKDFIGLKKSDFDFSAYNEFLNNHEHVIGQFRKYMISRLHDSPILESSFNELSFKIQLNDFATMCFADALIIRKELQISTDKLVFLLDLQFIGIKKIAYFLVDDDGFLSPIDFVKTDEYLYEQITSIDGDGLEIVFHLWKTRNLPDDIDGRIIVQIQAQKLIINEQQDVTWIQLFGNQFDDYYNYFKTEFNKGRYLSDYSQCLKLIDEFDS